jgi:hypothetical protein
MNLTKSGFVYSKIDVHASVSVISLAYIVLKTCTLYNTCTVLYMSSDFGLTVTHD